MSAKLIGQDFRLERALSLEIVRVTERAAVAAARLRGRGAEKKSDQAPSMPCAANSAASRSTARL